MTQEIWGTFKIQIGPATTKEDFVGAIIWRMSRANYTLSRLARQVMPQKRGGLIQSHAQAASSEDSKAL